MPELVPSGPETLVNATTSGDQTPAGLTVLTGGATVAAFVDDSSGVDVAKLRILGADGAPASGEITIAQTSDVQVAALGGGGFAVSWIEAGATQSFVKVETYDATGHANGDIQTLGTYNNALDLANGINSYGTPVGLHMTPLADGGYALAWSVSTHDSMSFEHTSPTLVVASATGAIEASNGLSGSGGKGYSDYNMHATPVQLANGEVMVTWYQQASATSAGDYFAGQRFELFDAQGTPLTDAALLDPTIPADGGPTVDGHDGISVAATSDGHVVFAWNSAGNAEFSIYPQDTLGQGNLTGRTPPVSAGVITGEGAPQVVPTDGGGFAIVWSGSGDGNDLLAHLYSNNGTPVGSTFHVGDITAGSQDMPLVTVDGAGLAAIWRDDSHLAAGGITDPSGAAVMDQAYEPSSTPNLIVGTDGSDALAGGPAPDWLNGLAGADTLTGGGGEDKFIFTVGGGVDRVLDFTPGQDHVLLFDTQGNIVDASHGPLIFQAASNSLWFDADGGQGPQAPQEVAVMDGVTSLSQSDLAAGLEPRAIKVVAADGSMQQTVIDWGHETWRSTVTQFNPSGGIESYTVNQDDGSHWTRIFDVNADQVWSSRTVSYDAAGAQTSYDVAFDDGTRQVFTYDPHNTEPWQRIVDNYDAAGALVTRTIVEDDGAYKVATFDVANTQPWSMVVDVYNASGVQTGHWTYNDDGTFVG